MKGDQRLAHIVFRNGALFVPKEKVVLQKLLSLYRLVTVSRIEYLPHPIATYYLP